jgi:anti-anti-sigma regulatory factor
MPANAELLFDGAAHLLSPRRIDVVFDADRIGAYDAVVALQGEHDVGTREAVRVALAPLRGHVLVDLLGCDFVDATVVRAILDKAAQLERLGYRLELSISTAVSSVTRIVEVLQLGSLLVIHRDRVAA